MNLPLPTMPWYKALNKRLEGSEWLVNAGIVAVIALSAMLLLRADRVAKTAWFVYLISP